MGHIVASPNLLWGGGIVPFRFDPALDRYRPPFDLSAPVGELPSGTGNRPDDVRKVQELLNRFEPAAGGPSPKLTVDGLVGPNTVAAIRKFQRNRFGWEDGFVEPGHATLVELTIDEVDPTTDQLKGMVLNAVHEWNRRVGENVRWVRHTPNRSRQPDFVTFVAGGPARAAGTSPAGRQGQGQELKLNLGRAREVLGEAGRGRVEGIVLHEMGHAAGLLHEHQRADRDDWVDIVEDNVDPHRLHNFALHEEPPSVPSGFYDFESMMHYHQRHAARAPGLTTIRRRAGFRGQPLPDPQPNLGSLDGFSPGDIATLTKLYPR